MQLYANYIKEREGAELITLGNYAFFTYKVLQDYLYVIDIYIIPEYRKKGLGRVILNMSKVLAKENGKKKILGSVAKEIIGKENSLSFLDKLGFEYFKEDEYMIYLVNKGVE